MAKAARWSDLTGVVFPDKPWLANYPRIIFISDMGDALSETECILPNSERAQGVPFWFLEQEIIENVSSEYGRRHIWIWLTKRPHRMAQFSRSLNRPWPTNLWVGTSITHPRTLNRVPDLLNVGNDQTVRYISIEPLWEEVSVDSYLKTGKIHWVIVGGESKQPKQETHAFDLSWARRLRDECRENGAAFFLKQVGGRVLVDGIDAPGFTRDGHGGDWDFWPADLRIRELPAFDRTWIAARTPEAVKREQPARRTRSFPSRIRNLDLPAIREVIRELEQSPVRDEARTLLADRFGVPPNTIDWCAANRTMAKRRGADWPFITSD
jgi:protein gp37